MELTSIQAHRLGGAAAVLIAVILMLSETGVVRGVWVRFLVPAGLLAWGLRSITHPSPGGAVASMHASAEIAQHVFIGIAVLGTGVVEALRACGRLRQAVWGLVLPAGLVAVGVLFFFHAQHGMDTWATLLIAQHRVIGVTLVTAAAAKAVAAFPNRQAQGFRLAWLVAVLLFGFELMLYTEGAMAP